MDIRATLAAIPYLALNGVEAAGAGSDARVRLPVRAELTNHVGTLHAGALYTLAETAAGIVAFSLVPEGRAVPLLRGASVRYLRRVDDDVEGEARVDAQTAAGVRAAFSETGRADVSVRATVSDAGGSTVLEAEFDYALRPEDGL